VWIEEVLGFKLQHDRLSIDPTIPSAWDGFKLQYRHREATYEIVVENPDHVCHGVAWIEVDGQRQSERTIHLVEDGGHHHVLVRMRSNSA
jgi:cellobiose phosphorylase